MPRIFDNIKQDLSPALMETLCVSHRADFCVGYFNLRGWKQLTEPIEQFTGGDGHCCRLLVGMQRLPKEDVLQLTSVPSEELPIDQATVVRLKKKLAENFREQCTFGTPANAAVPCLLYIVGNARCFSLRPQIFFVLLAFDRLF
jgi:hypothetical protein